MAIRIHLDVIIRDILMGWAVDDDSPDVPLVVEVLSGGRSLGTAVADEARSDLSSRGHDSLRIGFRLRLPGAILTGDVREFTARVAGNGRDPVTLTCVLLTTCLPFVTPADKPWVDTLENHPSPIPFDDQELDGVLDRIEDGEIDLAIGLARKRFRANRELFALDTGIVAAVSRHIRIKSFEQLMADRTHDWFATENRSLWQSQLVKKDAMQRVARRNLVAIPQQIARFSDPAELLALELPSSYVAKPDGLASAKGVFAVADNLNVFTGRPVTPKRIVASWKKLAETTDRIDHFIVEEFVTDRCAPGTHPIPLDFKVYVFGGTAGFLEVFDRNYPGPSRTPYSIGWHSLPEPFQTDHILGPMIRRPDNLDEVIEAAERVGQDVGSFCRVDLFNGPLGPVLGEITILPANGKNRTAYANLLIQQAYIVFEDEQLWSAEA